MYKSELAEEIKNRLSLLLYNPQIFKARQERANRKDGTIADILAEYNIAVTEAILNLQEFSVGGTIGQHRIDEC